MRVTLQYDKHQPDEMTRSTGLTWGHGDFKSPCLGGGMSNAEDSGRYKNATMEPRQQLAINIIKKMKWLGRYAEYHGWMVYHPELASISPCLYNNDDVVHLRLGGRVDNDEDDGWAGASPGSRLHHRGQDLRDQ